MKLEFGTDVSLRERSSELSQNPVISFILDNTFINTLNIEDNAYQLRRGN